LRLTCDTADRGKNHDPGRMALASGAIERRVVLTAVKTTPPAAVACGQS